ncbi:Glycosyl transferase family 2 [Flavobacterium fluvii]|uniref:Glycosyl transferase family 2 n=2 Tax=Flavobacterium fluvii TaxID=468056 RepID=A0A1M5INE3_9FLAO|nr:Glycosyl transferase family 2 [Flavobacterium fluvii]
MVNISVCMATYNGSKYIKEQLDSILMQLSDDDEVIVSDDGSIDNTLEIIKTYNDVRIKIFKNSFKNLILNFEFAISKASGNYIFLSDQDDIWMGNKVSVMMKELQSSDLVITDAQIIDAKGEILSESYYEINKSTRNFFSNLIINSYLGCALAYKASMNSYILPFPKSIPMHDIWIGNVISLKGKMTFLDDKLIKYRRHGGNASPTGEKSTFSFSYKILYRVRLINSLINRLVLKK